MNCHNLMNINTHHSPFGSVMPGLNYNGSDYRYGFNGMESDDEVKGSKNSYTTEFRQYDPRIGRWSSRDALANKFPFYTPYQFAGNKPTVAVDLDGLEDVIFHYFEQKDGSLISGATFFDIDEKTNEYLSKHMKVDLPPTGAVTTVKRQNGTFEILNASPSFELVAEKPAPKPLSLMAKIEKGMQGSSDNSYYEGATGFYDHGGGMLALTAATLPISIIATGGSTTFGPFLLNAIGTLNTVDDLTKSKDGTFVEKNIPYGGNIKLGVGIIGFGANANQLIKNTAENTPSILGYGFDLFNTSVSEGQAIKSTIDKVEQKEE